MRRTLQKISRCDNDFARIGTEKCELERQRAILELQCQDHPHTQRAYAVNNNIIESYSIPQLHSSINGNLTCKEAENRLITNRYNFGNIFPEFGDYRMAETVREIIRNSPSELANSSSFPLDHSVMLNSSWTKAREAAIAEETGGVSASLENTASMTGGRDSKKRKAEFGVAEEEARERENEITAKSNVEISSGKSKDSEAPKPDYIHVRARRGQATDSHSLAERARREKINKKMKLLQELVPGCSKVTGKAGMLDEIITYVQSLQRQVEFLSMKLDSLNPRIDLNVNSFFLEEAMKFPAYVASYRAAAATSEMANLACLQFNQAQQGASKCVTDMPQAQPLLIWEKDVHTLHNAEFQ